jgi:hypothetical protein
MRPWFYSNIIYGLLSLAFGLSGIRYCVGWPKFSEKKNKKRIERLKKYGVPILFFSIVLIAEGAWLLISALKNY